MCLIENSNDLHFAVILLICISQFSFLLIISPSSLILLDDFIIVPSISIKVSPPPNVINYILPILHTIPMDFCQLKCLCRVTFKDSFILSTSDSEAIMYASSA